ncbi:AraC family transcriptional regulator [Actibacterium atlanticum]|uniref:AraC family transcriptional regulator n=1 Tax=Actibacterium atlanticum TaxID=1461693 RepID=A0A058ZJH3_9RHOB|nr:AraC family transcriptional regulator [Actibacterium atlanticum]KCV81337.1 AraC family transcriptional regulator [Actibacterium atlanticum]
MEIIRSNAVGSVQAREQRNIQLDALKEEIRLRRGGLRQDLMQCELGVQSCINPQGIRSVAFHKPAALLVLSGRKEIHFGSQAVVARAGDILFVPAEAEVWMGKYPDTDSGEYHGLGLRFDLDTQNQFRSTYGKYLDSWTLNPTWCHRASDAVMSWITDWLAWSRRYPSPAHLHRHRLVELLLILAQEGVAGNLLLNGSPSLRRRAAQFIALDPARNWRLKDVCDLLGMSETALRRKLRAEETGFRTLLEEVRLMSGLAMVQEGDLPIGRIADAVGYQSQSRFTERFKQRFGVTPSQLRSGQLVPRQTAQVLPGSGEI